MRIHYTAYACLPRYLTIWHEILCSYGILYFGLGFENDYGFWASYMHILFSGKLILVLQEGLYAFEKEMICKTFIFAHSRVFGFAPLQELDCFELVAARSIRRSDRYSLM